MKTKGFFANSFGYLYMVLPRPVPNPFDQALGRSRGRLSVLVSWGSLLLFIGGWELAAGTKLFSSVFFPPPSAVLGEFWRFTTSSEFPVHLGASLRRILVGFPIGIAAGTALGVAAGSHWMIDAAIGPWLSILYSVPRYAYLPLFLIWFGMSDTMHYLFIAYAVSYQPFFWSRNAMLELDVNSIRAGYVDGATKPQLLRMLVFGPAASTILEGIRVGVFSAMSSMLYVESVGVSEGIGFLNQSATDLFQIRRQMAVLLVIAIMNTVAYQVLGWIQAVVVRLLPRNVD